MRIEGSCEREREDSLTRFTGHGVGETQEIDGGSNDVQSDRRTAVGQEVEKQGTTKKLNVSHDEVKLEVGGW